MKFFIGAYVLAAIISIIIDLNYGINSLPYVVMFFVALISIKAIKDM